MKNNPPFLTPLSGFIHSFNLRFPVLTIGTFSGRSLQLPRMLKEISLWWFSWGNGAVDELGLFKLR
jgi:hypothetical protein